MLEERILLVDDEPSTLSAVGDYLRAALGCEIHCAVDREEAQALIETYTYSVAITDLGLSPYSLDGLGLIRDLACLDQRPRIVVFTGRSNSEVHALARANGADEVLVKPTPLKTLVSVTRKLTPVSDHGTGVDGESSALHLVTQRGLAPYVQPIWRVDRQQAVVTGVEFLTHGPEGTPYERPDALFAYARKKRAEHILDRYSISAALEAAEKLSDHLSLSLNVHASSLGLTDAACWLLATTKQHGIAPSRVIVEVVEHAPVWNKGGFLANLRRLRDAGMRIALDDVGLGQSNYQMILDVRPDYFKVDRYFVAGSHLDKNRYSVMRSIKTLASEFGAAVVAEGVEKADDLQSVLELQIDYVQGFLFSRPMPVANFLRNPVVSKQMPHFDGYDCALPENPVPQHSIHPA